MGDFVTTGIPYDYALPGHFVEVSLGAGPVSGSALDYPILLVGNKTSAGSATVDSVVYGPTSATPLLTEQDAINLFGSGSELHRMFLRVTDSASGAGNQTTAIYAIAVTESGGNAATQVITFTTTATAAGTGRVFVNGDFVDFAIASGDNVTTIATAAKNAINAKTKWPVTAANASGVLTITAKQKGPRGNWFRGFAIILGTGVGTTSDVTAPAFYTGGTTADSNTTALATLLSQRFFTIVSAAEDATQLGALATQVAAQALPITGIRQWIIAGYNGTQANAITISTGLNSAYAEMVHIQNSDWPPCEMAAYVAGVYALYEVKPSPRKNFSGFGNGNNESFRIPAPLSGTVPSKTTLNTGIRNGLTPIGVNPNGSTYIVKRCTTRCLNGSNPDFRSRDSHKRTVAFHFADDWYAKLSANFSGKSLANSPARGAHVPGPNVATPDTVKGALIRLIRDYDENDNLKNVETIIANSVVQRMSSNSARIQTRVPLQVIDILEQTTTQLDEVG